MHRDVAQQNKLDMLLRETAKQDNAALPFEKWKETLLVKATLETSAALPFTSQRPVKSWRKQLTIGLSAAALLLLLGAGSVGAKLLFPAPIQKMDMNAASLAGGESGANKAAPQMAAEAAPMAPMMQDIAEDQIVAYDAPPAAAAKEAAPEGETAPAPGYGILGQPLESYEGPMPGGREGEAIEAVYAALAMEKREDYVNAYFEPEASYRVKPLQAGLENASVEKLDVYTVVLDGRKSDAPLYVVDANTMEVLGTVQR